MSLLEQYKRPASFLQTLFKWLGIVIGIVVLIFAWNRTEINLGALPAGMSDVQPLLKALVQPEILVREQDKVSIRTVLQIPCSDEPPVQMKPNEEGYLELSSMCADRGETVTVTGYNLQPDTEVTLYLAAADNPRRDRMARLTTDAEGRFETSMTVPSDWLSREEFLAHRVIAEAKWEVGPLRISDTAVAVLDKIVETILLALMATVFAIVFAIPISFLSARNLMTRTPAGTVIYYVVRFILNLLRAIEPLIWAIIFAVWVGVGPFAGVLALMLHSIAALGKLYSEQIESIESGPIEAITATGANPLQVIIYGVVPQIVPPYIAFTLYRWDINVRMSTVIGLVGGGGIGFLLIQWINLLQYRQAAVAVWAIAIVVAIMDYTSAIIREKIV